MDDILGKKDPLKLDNEEIDELFNILQRRLESFPGNGVVFLWSKGRRETL